MKNAARRATGTAKEVGGKLARKAGRAVGSERLEAEGRAKELEGRAQKERVKRRERVKGAVEEVAGELRRLKGRARQAANR